MEKINIVEILKNCPPGMELNCTIYENVEFDLIDTTPEVIYPIHCLIKTNVGYESLLLTSDGCINRHSNAKCVIFPENKTTWKGFVPPCKFKDGDIIIDSSAICIFKGEGMEKGTVDYYCGTHTTKQARYFNVKDHKKNPEEHYGYIDDYRLATEEEKQKLFKVIKDNGYKWNDETKILEKLVEPKFNVGNRIRCKKNKKQYIITKIHNDCYECDDRYVLTFKEQNNWEVVPNKFDISTLKPFESRVLVRNHKDQIWKPAIFGGCVHDSLDNYKYIVIGGIFSKYLIPYKGNEHLLGKINDCTEYYKTWEE